MQQWEQPQSAAVNVKGVDLMELRVECPGGMENAHARWLDPQLYAKAVPLDRAIKAVLQPQQKPEKAGGGAGGGRGASGQDARGQAEGGKITRYEVVGTWRVARARSPTRWW
jgi:hypothetical protein